MLEEDTDRPCQNNTGSQLLLLLLLLGSSIQTSPSCTHLCPPSPVPVLIWLSYSWMSSAEAMGESWLSSRLSQPSSCSTSRCSGDTRAQGHILKPARSEVELQGHHPLQRQPLFSFSALNRIQVNNFISRSLCKSQQYCMFDCFNFISSLEAADVLEGECLVFFEWHSSLKVLRDKLHRVILLHRNYLSTVLVTRIVKCRSFWQSVTSQSPSRPFFLCAKNFPEKLFFTRKRRAHLYFLQCLQMAILQYVSKVRNYIVLTQLFRQFTRHHRSYEYGFKIYFSR